MNFLDLVIVGVVLFGGLVGYRKGLINAVIGILSSILSLGIAFATYQNVALILNKDLGLGRIVQSIVRNVLGSESSFLQPLKGNGLEQLQLITNALPVALQKDLNDTFTAIMKSAIGTAINTFGDAITQFLAQKIITVIAFLLIFMVAKLIIGFVAQLLTNNLDRNIVGSMNHSGGFLLGIVASVLFIAIATGFLVPLLTIYSRSTLTQLLNQSLLTPLFAKLYLGLVALFG